MADIEFVKKKGIYQNYVKVSCCTEEDHKFLVSCSPALLLAGLLGVCFKILATAVQIQKVPLHLLRRRRPKSGRRPSRGGLQAGCAPGAVQVCLTAPSRLCGLVWLALFLFVALSVNPPRPPP